MNFLTLFSSLAAGIIAPFGGLAGGAVPPLPPQPAIVLPLPSMAPIPQRQGVFPSAFQNTPSDAGGAFQSGGVQGKAEPIREMQSTSNQAAFDATMNEKRAKSFQARGVQLEKEISAYEKAVARLLPKGFVPPTDCSQTISALKTLVPDLKGATSDSDLDDLQNSLADPSDFNRCVSAVRLLTSLKNDLSSMARSMAFFGRSKDRDMTVATGLYADVQADLLRIKAGVTLDELDTFFDKMTDLRFALFGKDLGVPPINPKVAAPTSFIPFVTETGSIFDGVWPLFRHKFLGM